jgi:hypothetical protein
MSQRRAKILVVILGFAAACRAGESRVADSTHAPATVATDPVAAPQSITDSTPAGVIRRYYAAIQSGRYADAYALWSDSGRASGKTAREFADGFKETASVSVSVGDSARIEGAAGSQYATIPVVVDAVLTSGARQRFTGTYTLRRAMVDGATDEQRQWRIYSAELHTH